MELHVPFIEEGVLVRAVCGRVVPAEETVGSPADATCPDCRGIHNHFTDELLFGRSEDARLKGA